jgi:SAM-dependent methyltransferase
MKKTYEEKYHKLEENNWWFLSRQEMILQLIEGTPKNAHILEVGCSGGPLLKRLNKSGWKNTTGIDISKKAIMLCKKGGIDNAFVMDCSKTNFREGQFDLIIASDILEHVKNDVAALNEWERVLKPRGKLVIFVPAFNFLWSEHDMVNMHHRRYTRRTLINALCRAGFNIDRSAYWNFALFFPTAAVRILQRALPKKKKKSEGQLYKLNPVTNKMLLTLLRSENTILKKLNFPFGVSVFVVANKKS